MSRRLLLAVSFCTALVVSSYAAGPTFKPDRVFTGSALTEWSPLGAANWRAHGSNWMPVAEGDGSGRTTLASFPPVRAKFARLTQIGTALDAPPWSVVLLRLFEV